MLSVIIPALDEEEHIAATVRSALTTPGVEVLVVDGGSRDATREEARRAGARVVPGETGRGRQMNRGAALASGDSLLFLHADTLLPPFFAQRVLATLYATDCIAGAFSLRVAGPERSLRLIERSANWRSRRFGLPYGDQGIFLAKQTFRKVGGIPEQEIMEDFEFMRRLGRLGSIAILPEAVETSARRWRRVGVLRLSLIHQALIAAYLLGVPPLLLARWYHAITR